jgi:broad specificity phosphatase PhoE
MRTSDIRDPDDLLAHVASALKTQGRPVDPGMVVELEPLFHEVFLGGEITRLDRVIEAATAGRWLRPVGGDGRRYALTATGAERARSIHRNVLRRLPRWQRVLIAILVVVVLAILLL